VIISKTEDGPAGAVVFLAAAAAAAVAVAVPLVVADDGGPVKPSHAGLSVSCS
jgi:hypothetical protein